MERDVVVDALSEVQKGDGSGYLEKIIHVPFEVPVVSQLQVLEFLIKNINGLLDDDEHDEVYLGNVFQSGFKYFFKNIRDVKRYMNVFKFNYNALGKELNDADLMAMIALQVFEPKVYDEIRTNKTIFTGYISNDEQESAKEILENIPRSFLNGHPEKRLPNNAHFRFDGIEGESLLLSLNDKEIAVSTGSACSSKTLEPSHTLIAMGLLHEEAHGSLELSIGRFTKESDIDSVIKALPEVVDRLRKLSPIY